MALRALAALLLAVAAHGAITVKHADPTVPNTPYTDDQLQDAIDDPLTVCGDIIEIDPGASRHNYDRYWLRGPALDPSLGGPAVEPSHAKNCASSGKYITIRSSQAYQLTPGKRVGSADAAHLAFVGLLPDLTAFGTGCTVFESERAANYWRLQGLDIAATQGNCSGGGSDPVRITYAVPFSGGSGLSRLEDFPHHITLDQCWIHGIDSFPVRDGMQLEGISINLINSTIDNIRTATGSGQEAHAIISVNGRGPFRMVNNKLSGGQNTLIIGGAISATKRPMEQVEFSNNWVYRPYKWMDWSGPTDPTPLSPCPVDADAHGATYRNTGAVTYWECRGAAPGTWTSIAGATYDSLVAVRIPTLGKNLIEFKDASGWHIEGNLEEQASGLNETGQNGSCFNWSTLGGPDVKMTDMLVENNLCRHAGWGWLQGGSSTGASAISSIVTGSTTTTINMVTSNPFMGTGVRLNVLLEGTGPGCAAAHGAFVVTQITSLQFTIAADTSAGCTDVSGSVTDFIYNPGGDVRFWTNSGRPFHNILFRNNLYQHMGEDMYTQPAFGAIDGSGYRANFVQTAAFASFGHNLADGVTVDHNTYQAEFTGGNALTNIGVRTGDLAYDPAFPGINQRVTNNIFTAGKCPIGYSCNGNAIAGGWGPYAELAANGVIDNLGLGMDLSVIGGMIHHCDPGAGLPGCAYSTAYNTYPPNCLGCEKKYGTPTALKFANYPNDLTLQSDSPLKAAGLDGKDLGADLNTVGWATAGAEAGTMAPYLAMKIRAVIPAATSVQVRFSAVNTSSCTVEARKYGFPLSSPTSAATDSSGTLDRLVTLTGLSGNTKYGLKVTCAGSYYRDDDFRTP